MHCAIHCPDKISGSQQPTLFCTVCCLFFISVQWVCGGGSKNVQYHIFTMVPEKSTRLPHTIKHIRKTLKFYAVLLCWFYYALKQPLETHVSVQVHCCEMIQNTGKRGICQRSNRIKVNIRLMPNVFDMLRSGERCGPLWEGCVVVSVYLVWQCVFVFSSAAAVWVDVSLSVRHRQRGNLTSISGLVSNTHSV